MYRSKMNRIFFLFSLLSSSVFPQQILNPSNYYTVDNLAGSAPTLCDSFYCEIPSSSWGGWWTNTGSVWYGGSHRRTPNLQGSPDGASATYYFNIPYSASYLVYHYMGFTGNATTNAYVTCSRMSDSTIINNFRYNIRDNNVNYGTQGSWKPLSIVNIPAGYRNLAVKIGADSLTPSFLRVDAVRILRSTNTGADLEFGKRHFTAFDTARMPEEFPQTIFHPPSYSEKKVHLYNLGVTDLHIFNISFSTNRFLCINFFPILIPSGGNDSVTIRFFPKGEEITIDTMIIQSNDPEESLAKLPVIGEGINYNFIMNASEGGIEPHWNAPANSNYIELGAQSNWLNSTRSPFLYPISNGNLYSRYNLNMSDTAIALYKFEIPEGLSGDYIFEYSGPSGSPTAATNICFEVITPGRIDTQRVCNINQRGVAGATIWILLADSSKRIFQLNSGGSTIVRLINPYQSSSNYLRTDLLRVRKLPLLQRISTNLDSINLLDFGQISLNDTLIKTFDILSIGEIPLIVNQVYLKSGVKFKIINPPPENLILSSVNGKYTINISFIPDSIKTEIDTLIIISNDTLNSPMKIFLKGEGVLTDVKNANDHLREFVIYQNFPNPFNSSTIIRYRIPTISHTKLVLFNTLGEKIDILEDDIKQIGEYEILFNKRNYASGLYLLYFEIKSLTSSKDYKGAMKLVLLK